MNLLRRLLVSEAQLQRAIVDYLRLKGWLVIETYVGSARGGQVWHTKGMPDLYVARPGRAVWLEVKTPTGRLSSAQRELHCRLHEAGVEVYVVRSLEDVQRYLEGSHDSHT